MVRYRKLVYIIIFSFLATVANSKNPPPGTGTADVPANILIMLDDSGSMNARVRSSSALYYPTQVQTDSNGNMYILDYSYTRISKYDANGNFLKSFGRWGYGCEQWTNAWDFKIYNDQIYITGGYWYDRTIRILNLDGKCIKQSSRYTIPFTYARGIAVTNNYIYIRDYYNRIAKFSRSTLRLINTQTFSNRQLYYSYGLSVNNAENKLIAGNGYWGGNPGLTEFNIGGGGQLSVARQSCTSYSSTNGCFRRSQGADYDSNGNVYATDYYNNRLQKLNSSLRYNRKTGSWSNTNPFYYPFGVHVDKNNKVYVADTNNRAVRIYDTNLSLLKSIGGSSGTRLDISKEVIKKIVSNTDLTSGANFGLMEWNSSPRMRVNISDNGAKQIYTDVMNIRAGGGTNLRSAMMLARSYFRSSVKNYKQSCVKNYLIVISDGYWSSHGTVLSIADQMNRSDNIQTFAVGLDISHNNYVQLAQKGGTKTPLYASNANDLLNKLTDAIKQAISGRLTFTTPAIMSDVTKGDFIYQSTFKYEKDKQWKGNLKKYKLKADGTFDAELWDAATKLNSKKASARNIWTIGIGNSSLNNFTTSNRDQLKALLFSNAQNAVTNTQVDNLINFIRGVDTYDQDGDKNTTEEIHKLADIYNSDVIVVGAPEASTSDNGNSNFNKTDAFYRLVNNYNNFKNGRCGSQNCQQRTEVILAGANNGILHAFKTSDGNELWGYVPPIIFENLERIPSSKANTTNSVYGVDGSPVVKDIYYADGNNKPRWRTVLFSGVGAGGKGFFALDITDINNPKHLFAIKNDFTNKTVTYWDENENINQFGYAGGNISSEFDYRKLGETWSTPRIVRMKISGKDKWVAVLGGGYNGGINPNYGSAVFVVDIENGGRLLKKIDILDTSTSNIVNSIPADLRVITANSTDKADYNGAMVYAADLEGKISKINLTDVGTLYETATFFDAQSNTSNGRYLFNSPEATINSDGNLWLYFGTGNSQKLQEQSSSVRNRVYGIKDTIFPRSTATISKNTVQYCSKSSCPTAHIGWYVDLPNSRKVTAEPTIDKDRVYFPLYEPTYGANSCKTGKAILSAYDSLCGSSVLMTEVGTGVLSKVLVRKDRLYMGISGEVKKNVSGFTNKDNLLSTQSKAVSQGKQVQIEFWRENY
jgi:type IV pilus assembly protein PilY1